MTEEEMVKSLAGQTVKQVDSSSGRIKYTVRFTNGIYLTLTDNGEAEWYIELHPTN
jgi:hypothetical protein